MTEPGNSDSSMGNMSDEKSRPELIVRNSPAKINWNIHSFVWSGVAVALLLAFVDWRIIPVPFILSAVFVYLMLKRKKAYEQDRTPRLIFDASGIYLDFADVKLAWNDIERTAFWHPSGGSPWRFVIKTYDAAAVARASGRTRIGREWVLGSGEISISLGELDASRDDIRAIIRHHVPQLEPE